MGRELPERRVTREVRVGDVAIGSAHPIRVQSMTHSNTRDVAATVDQIMALADEGCDIARVTVQGKKEAEACESIKSQLIQKGYTIPLVADIHFYPPAALKVVESVDKVRINPGNYIDKRASFQLLEYDALSYQRELERIEEGFTPLVLKCKELGKAMRIGTNHGSLSDRIMNRFGDTPAGMVESALEFAHVCRGQDFHNFLFSMKASNPKVMIAAYRLLVSRMDELGWDYPLHLGVTEAGEGEDGRVKSAIGMGTLLLDGIGDTIRVSLTEDPWEEIAPCKQLVRLAESSSQKGVLRSLSEEKAQSTKQLPPRLFPKGVALHRDGAVWVEVREEEILRENFFEQLGLIDQGGELALDALSADGVIFEGRVLSFAAQEKLKLLVEVGVSVITPLEIEGRVALLSLGELERRRREECFSLLSPKQEPVVLLLTEREERDWKKAVNLEPSVILFRPKPPFLPVSRRFFLWCEEVQLSTPVVLSFRYGGGLEEKTMDFAAEAGALLCEGWGDGVSVGALGALSQKRKLSFSVLQGARRRASKTEFISCPSCGRTLFDLQDVTRKIQKRTAHLPGVKIAIMGCIVNGPGEMADADFGYVGSRPGKIDLYVGKERVEKNIPFEEADGRLVQLIQREGRWLAPPEEVSV